MTITILALRNLVQLEQRQHPQLTTRLDKAATIVTLRTIAQNSDGTWVCDSEDGLGSYNLPQDLSTCQCPDFTRVPGDHHCKHRLAVKMTIALANQDAGGMLPKTIVGWTATKTAVRPPAPAQRPAAPPVHRPQRMPWENDEEPAAIAATRPRITPVQPVGPISCPDHGQEKLKPSKFAGMYCTGRNPNGTFCKWTTGKPSARERRAA